jgi:FkbM family methyltransferase
MDVLSSLNLWLRHHAGHINPNHPVRRRVARAWAWFLRRAVPTVVVPIGGVPLRLSARFRSWSADYECETLRTFRRLVGPGAVVWDVGANLGIYSLIAARLVGAQGQVIAWEPSPPVFRYLQEHYEANGAPAWVELVPEAIHDGRGLAVRFLLDLYEGYSLTGRFAGQAGGGTVSVPAASLDSWHDRLDRSPDWVKVDVEGAEVFVLRGAARLMAPGGKRRPAFLVAVHPMFLPDLGCQPEEIVALIRERDYVALSVAGVPVRPVEYSEYLLVPRERVEEVQARLRDGWEPCL